MNGALSKRRYWFGEGDNTLSNKSYDSQSQQEEHILIKNIVEVLMAPLIHFLPTTVPGTEIICQ